MINYFLLIAIILLLWHVSLSTSQCTRTITNEQVTFSCPSTITDQELSLYDLTVNQLDNIISIVAGGTGAGTSGPFTSIPPNICLLRNLQSINFASNQISVVDPTGSLNECLSNVVTLDLSFNIISQFPSDMTYNMSSLKSLNFRGNQLTEVPPDSFSNISSLETINFSYNQFTTFELWPLEVQTMADFSNNQISMITNKYLLSELINTTNEPTILLTNNAPTINFTDAIYEMYNQCEEVYTWYVSNAEPEGQPEFTRKLAHIDFGTTQINCSCDQRYFLQILENGYATLNDPRLNLPIKNATCINNSQNINNVLFINSSCAYPLFDHNSTVNFSQVYPRFCKIYSYEPGQLTNIVNMSEPSLNVSAYPHYITAFLNPGACFFTFINQTAMNLKCTNDTSNTLSSIPKDLLSNSYMSNITIVTYPSPISSLPSYLCALPSHEIDLSYQDFTTLTDATFPCLDSFYQVILSFNQITSVNMTNGNFTNLTILDLSSNLLTTLPYSILRPTPTSLRYLNLANNSITSIDLFLYTLKNITVNLAGNPINSSSIINPENATLASNTSSTVNITFPPSVTTSIIIIQDTTAASLFACSSFAAIRSFLLNFRSATTRIFLECTCASYSLKELYQENGANILTDFSCSNPKQQLTYESLTNGSCTNVTNFQAESCNAAVQVSTTTLQSPTTASSSQLLNQSSSNTGLIVGLVVGIIGFLILLCILIGVFLMLKSKKKTKKTVTRAKANGQTAGEALSSRVQPRNLRSVRLAPILTPTSELPKVPVATALPKANSSPLYYSNNHLPTSAKGIPVRPDAIRSPTEISPQYPPNSNALNNSSSFRPINNVSTHQVPISQQQVKEPKPKKPRTNFMLNAGGDTRY